MNRKLLPIGIQTFRKIRESDYYYVDKTGFACQLAESGGYYFISRPRRFGKSLFLDTLAEMFEGNRPLFSGLDAESRWDWSKQYPVIRISFAEGVLQSREELDRQIVKILQHNQQRLQVNADSDSGISNYFLELIQAVERKYQQHVVVLVDEYDKPILDNIDHPERAVEIREGLKNLYSVLKGQDAYLRFVMLTGVSKFSKVSLFSGINHLRDITLSPAFSSICGYTDEDVDTLFSPELEGLDREQIRDWYNGYSWGGESVYNPFDLLLLFSDRIFRPYWFETGSPSFLLKLFKQQRFFLPQLEKIEASEALLESFDIERINPVTLLFQSGYLTITDTQDSPFAGRTYTLSIPNKEVRTAMNNHFVGYYAEIEEGALSLRNQLYRCLMQGDLTALEREIKSLFSGIPWRNFTNNDLPETEGYYASVLYAFFASLNATIIPEDISNRGQADLTVILGEFIYVIEIKRDTQAEYQPLEQNPALLQIKQRGYADKYRSSGKTVYQVGMIFNTHARNLVQMDFECFC